MNDLLFKFNLPFGSSVFDSLTTPKRNDPKIDRIAREFCRLKKVHLQPLELEDLKTSIGFLYNTNEEKYWIGMWDKVSQEFERIIGARKKL